MNVHVGCGCTEESLAERWADGRAAANTIEDRLDSWWVDAVGDSVVDRITADSYDNSLEVYFVPEVADLEATPEQIKAIADMGFGHFWLNFKGGTRKGGTERHYCKIRVRDDVATYLSGNRHPRDSRQPHHVL